MSERTRTGSKWRDLTGALRGVLSRRPEVAWGLSLFPASARRACMTSAVNVAPAMGSASTITSLVHSTYPGGAGTPTRDAVLQAGRELLASSRPTRKYLLLATDGEPNCLPGHRNPNAPDIEGTTQAIRSLAEQGVTTFVLGVAVRPGADGALRAMAQAGGHARQGMTAYYTANDARELDLALDEVARQVALCTFDLSTPPPAGSALSISIGGRSFPRNQRHAGDGWDVTSAGRAIALYGAACDAVQAGATIEARYGCAPGTRCDEAAMACVGVPGAQTGDGGVSPSDAGANTGQGMGAGNGGWSGGPTGSPGTAGGGSAGTAGGGSPGTPGSGQCPLGCGVDQRCRYDAQCGAGGLCEGGQCRRACVASSDCGTGDTCQSGHCRPDGSDACAFNGDCAAGAVCVNGQCHRTCTKGADCTRPQDICDRGLCRADTGRVASCRSKGECAAGLDCVDGLCRTPCCTAAECAAAASGPVCWTGYCFKQNEAVPACFLDADCGPGRTCANATCR